MSAIGRVTTSIPVERLETAGTALFRGIGNALVTGIIRIAFVALGIIIDIARTYMRRIITAAIIVGIIIIEIARTYRQVNPWTVVTVATTPDLDHIIAGAFAGIQK
jgi:hypothetical protein